MSSNKQRERENAAQAGGAARVQHGSPVAANLPALAQFAQCARDALATLDADARARVERGLARIGVTVEEALAHVRPPELVAYAVGLWQGATATDAAAAAGLSLTRNWGDIEAQRARDPIYKALIDAATAAQRARIRAKAARVAENALDGAEVTREAARLAALMIKEDGAGPTAAARSAAPQVVINITDGAAFNGGARDNPLKDSKSNVIDL